MKTRPEVEIAYAQNVITSTLIANMRTLDQAHLELAAVWASNVSQQITRELKRRRRNESNKEKKRTRLDGPTH